MRRRHIQIKLVKDNEVIQTEKDDKVIFVVHALANVERASKIALRLYATKKFIDFAAQAGEHIVVTKIR